MKLVDTVKQVNQKTGEVKKTNRAFVINTCLIEMRLLGLVTQAQEDSIGGEIDKLFAKERAELNTKVEA